MALTREQIIQADDLAVLSIDVPEWGGEVLARPLTGREFKTIKQNLSSGRHELDVMLDLIVMSIVDESGDQVFTYDDLEAIGGKKGDVLLRVGTELLRHNGLLDDDDEEIAGN